MSVSKKKMPAWLWMAGAGLVVLALLGFVTFRFATRATRAGSPAAGLETGEVTTITATNSVESSGTLQAQQSASLNWKTTGIVATVEVELGQTVEAGEVLMTLDPASVPQNVILAQADLIAAQKALDDLLHPGDLAIANAQKSVVDAQDALEKAEQNLRNVENPAGESLYEAVSDAKLALETAQANLQLSNVSTDVQALNDATWQANWALGNYQTAQARFEASNGSPDALAELQKAEAYYQNALDKLSTLRLRIQTDQANKGDTAAKAQDRYDTAVANLDSALAGPDADRVAIAQAKLAVAQATLTEAQSKLTQLTDGADPTDLASAQARVQAAQATVEMLTLKAPFAGEVLAIFYQPGDAASLTQVAVVMANRSQLHVDATVDESDVSQIVPGNPVILTFGSLPDLTLDGAVTWIQPYGETVQGLVKYTVRVDLKDGDPRLLLGMTANTSIVTQVLEGSLAVPLDAVQLDAEGEFVNRLGADGAVERVPVVSGILQGDRVVVTGSLNPGDKVQLVKPKPAQMGGPFGG